MGWFKGRQIFTATAVFNLSGSLKDRPSFLKTTVIGAILNGSDSLGATLSKAYLNGPGTRLKGFHNWALANYQAIGVPGSTKLTLRNALPSYIEPEIVNIQGYSNVRVIGINSGEAQFSYWVEQRILQHFPQYFGGSWVSEIDPVTNLITITFPDNTVDRFLPQDFIRGAYYLYATFTYKKSETVTGQGIFIYRIGSGKPTLDALLEIESNPSDAFLAPIPLRIGGKFLSKRFRPSTYALANKACKKALGVEIDEIISNIEESPDVDDMDYVYVVFGAPANTGEQAARRYIFEFLEDLAQSEQGSEAEFVSWVNTTHITNLAFTEWRNTVEVAPPDPSQVIDPGPNPNSPPPSGGPSRPSRTIKIENPGGNTNYDVRLSWASLSMVSGTGLAKPNAVVGEYWFSLNSTEFIQRIGFINNEPDSDEIDIVYLYHQETADSWRAVKIIGMSQKTFVFGNNFEELTLASQISRFGDDPDRESAFLFPIRYSSLANMNLKDATQFATSCAFLQIHAYEIHIQRIYETPLFSFVLMAIVIGITAATGGLGAAGAGILGSNAAVGAALGITSVLSATIVGVAANALAAMAVTAIITKVSTEIFGAKLGAIIGVVASIIVVNGLSNLASNGTFAINFGSLSTAETILTATSAVSRAYTAYVQADIQNIMEKSEDLAEQYSEQMRELSESYAEQFGYGNGIIDPLQFLGMSQELTEAPEEFLKRTLMTGSDIAELTMLMLSNFTEISLKLDGPR